MKKLTTLILMTAALCLALAPAHADLLFNSGQPTDNGYTINWQSPGYAMMETIPTGGWHVTGLEAYLTSKTSGKTFGLALRIYANIFAGGYDIPDANNVLSESIVSVPYNDYVYAWRGDTLDKNLPAGKTWFSLEMVTGSEAEGWLGWKAPNAFGEIMASRSYYYEGWGTLDSYPPVNPAIPYSYVDTQNYFGYRITGEANPVPIPGAVYLLGSGLLGLTGWGWRRKS